jgi:branched-chain amino acid transport system substrate-binding protein
MAELRVGVLAHLTGRLSLLGPPMRFAAQRWQHRRTPAGDQLRITLADTGSEPDPAVAAVTRLVRVDGVRLILTLGGTHTVPAIAAACARLGVPCLSTTLPWQVYHSARATADWGFHFCWGLDDIAHAFADAWTSTGRCGPVGCLWNDGPQGRALRASEFAAVAADRGVELVDPGGYAEDRADFRTQIAAFRAASVQTVTAAATPGDLRRFHRAAAGAGLSPELLTCSRWLSYPDGAHRSGVDDVATAVYWSPEHPFRSAADGTDCSELAARFSRATGQEWLQPLGLAYALGEICWQVLSTTADPTEPAALAERLRRAHVHTVAGPVDWTTGPAAGIASLPLATGQWQAGELVVVANERTPDVPLGGRLRLAR